MSEKLNLPDARAAKSWLKKSRRDQFADVVQVLAAHRTQLRCLYRGHGYRSAGQGDKFRFIGHAILVNVNDRAHVTGQQTFGGKVSRQHHAIMFFDIHNSSKG